MADNEKQNAPAWNVPDDAPLRRAGYKDLSLVSLVPRWSGGESALPIHEFFGTIEGSAAIWNWTQADMKQVCALKLTDAVRAFYSATPELRSPNTTWQDFKSRFLQRFRDVRSAQYHFGQLYMARQKITETAQEFLDRCRLLARRTVPCTTDPLLQQAYNTTPLMYTTLQLTEPQVTRHSSCCLATGHEYPPLYRNNQHPNTIMTMQAN